LASSAICKPSASFAGKDCFSSTEFREILKAARATCATLDRTINRAEKREATLRNYGYLAPEGAA
jgi:hypothetical protein